jgi:hypothetical protein
VSAVSFSRCLVLAVGTLVLSGCISPKAYVDRSLGDVPPDKRVVVANPHPVQLIFEFQTKGATNSRGTKALAPQAMSAANDSRVFSEISSSPVSNGAVLSIKINNVPITDDAAAKGFMTGLTFGLAGTAVTDGYVCTVDYLPGGDAPRVTTQVKHAIHTVIGNKSPPPNSDRAASLDEAAFKVTRQMVSHGLNQLAADPKFK